VKLHCRLAEAFDAWIGCRGGFGSSEGLGRILSRRRRHQLSTLLLAQHRHRRRQGGVEVAEFEDKGLGPIHSGTQITEPIPSTRKRRQTMLKHTPGHIDLAAAAQRGSGAVIGLDIEDRRDCRRRDPPWLPELQRIERNDAAFLRIAEAGRKPVDDSQSRHAADAVFAGVEFPRKRDRLPVTQQHQRVPGDVDTLYHQAERQGGLAGALGTQDQEAAPCMHAASSVDADVVGQRGDGAAVQMLVDRFESARHAQLEIVLHSVATDAEHFVGPSYDHCAALHNRDILFRALRKLGKTVDQILRIRLDFELAAQQPDMFDVGQRISRGRGDIAGDQAGA
jgi:hypothetical protein